MLKKGEVIILIVVVAIVVGCSTETGSGGEGTPEACGDGVCDSVEEANNLCAQDCEGDEEIQAEQTITETIEQETSATAEEAETILDTAAAAELLDATLDAYDQVNILLEELQTLVDTAASAEDRESVQEEIDAKIRQIDALSDTIKYEDHRVLQGTGQQILSATEEYRPAGTPWQRIVDAVNNLQSGNQKVEFTYSFIVAGTEMENGESVDLKDYEDGSLSNEEFKQEIREGITAWESLFEEVFNTAHGYSGNLEVIVTDLGDETGTSTPSNSDVSVYDVPGTENLGDLRYGMEAYDSLVTGTPFSPTGRPGEGESDSSGDVHYNSNIDWRTDRSTDSGTSVMIVTAHETGHGLAYQHEENGLMAPPTIVAGSFTELFPNGLSEDDAVVAATMALYGAEAQTTTRQMSTEEGTDLSIPSVNAATLGVSAIKVRSADEIEASQQRVEEAVARLQEYREDVEALRDSL